MVLVQFCAYLSVLFAWTTWTRCKALSTLYRDHGDTSAPGTTLDDVLLVSRGPLDLKVTFMNLLRERIAAKHRDCG